MDVSARGLSRTHTPPIGALWRSLPRGPLYRVPQALQRNPCAVDADGLLTRTRAQAEEDITGALKLYGGAQKKSETPDKISNRLVTPTPFLP